VLFSIHLVVKSDFPDSRKIVAVHSVCYRGIHIFPHENNADGWPAVRLYAQVEKRTSNRLPWEPKARIIAEDAMKTNMRVRFYRFTY
jgi:hypothetical protein